jgi:L-fucose isomerase-like protein
LTTLGVLVGNSGSYPSEICEHGRKTVLSLLEEEGIKSVILGAKDSRCGAVESIEEARKCADLFRLHREEIDGVLVTLPNRGDERGAAEVLRRARLEVPVLVHAFPDEAGRMGIEKRRDGYAGKIALCNALAQYGIKYTLTSQHTMDPETEGFREDLRSFAGTCNVVRGLAGARFGQIGARPAPLLGMRYSETLLERAGITVETIDLSELFARAWALKDKDSAVAAKLDEIKGYFKTLKIPKEALMKMTKLAVGLDQLISEHELSGTAVQCWTSMEENFGVAPCTVMSMLSNSLSPSACETDVTGLIGMRAMVLASGKPSGLLEWSNDYGEDPDKAVLFHCGNLPQDLLGKKGKMDFHEPLAGTMGKDKTHGTVAGKMRPTEITYCRVSTDDRKGTVRAYVGEGEITKDPITSFGSYGVVKVPNLPGLLRHICENGFTHHVAVNPSRVGSAVREAFSRYLGWTVYGHDALLP